MAQSLARDLAQNGRCGIGYAGRSPFVETFLRLDEVKRATGLGRSTIYDLMAEDPPRFPKPVKIVGDGGKAVAWLESEIARWQQQRIAERDGVAA